MMPAILLLLLLLFPGPSAMAQPATGDPDLDRFHALERALFDALHAKNREALERLLAGDYVLRGAPDVDRNTWLRNAVTLCWGTRSDLDGLTVTRLGDAAVVSFTLTMYEDPRTCEDAIIRSLVTDVWEEQDGEWRLAVRHSGPVGGPDIVARQFETVPLPPPRWELSGELSLVATGGNADTQTIGAGAELTFRPGPWTTTLEAAFVRTEAEAIENARSLGVDLRQSRTVSDRLELFGHAVFLQDRFAGIDPRVGGDAGVAYRLVAAAPHLLRLDAGLGATRETRLSGANVAFATANLLAHYELALSDTTGLENDTAFTLDLEDAENWRLNETLAFTAGLNQMLSLKVSYALKYLNLPVPGFEKTDTVVSAALVATLSGR